MFRLLYETLLPNSRRISWTVESKKPGFLSENPVSQLAPLTRSRHLGYKVTPK